MVLVKLNSPFPREKILHNRNSSIRQTEKVLALGYTKPCIFYTSGSADYLECFRLGNKKYSYNCFTVSTLDLLHQ